MFKRWMAGFLAAGALALAAAGFYAVAPALAANSVALQEQAGGGPGGRGRGPAVTPPAGTGLALPAAGDLSAEEAAGLAWMYEEEKLARDVYTALYDKWGAAVFSNIARSEQAHMDAVKVLLDRYGLSVPGSNEAGVFADPILQALYTDLVARGSQSLEAALQVGVEIENLDIADLDKRLAQTDNADIQQVYQNLRRGSENHLRAFSGENVGGARQAAPGRPGGRGRP